MENYGKSNTVSVGPWGGQDGVHWDDGLYSTVRQMEITHATGIDSVRVEYDWNGTSVWSEKHGGNGGYKTDKVKLEYPGEFLTSIHGYYGSLNGWGVNMIKSLTLTSNKRTYGPFGPEEGTYFSLPMIWGKIVGFHGKAGWYLDAIGVHLEPIHKQNPQNSIVQYSRSAYAANDNFGYSMIQGNLGKQYDLVIALRQGDGVNTNSLPDHFPEKNKFTLDDQPAKQIQAVTPPTIPRVPYKNVQGTFTYGPWGGTGGTPFDDAIYDGVRQINVKRNVGIASIRVCYDFKGETVWGSKNGGSGSFKKDLIVFDYPSEILTHMTGFHGPTMVMGPNVIKSLTFHTTKTKYGPYGDEQGIPFSSNLGEGKIVGFHGRKGLFLDAIGVHVIEGKVVPPVSSPTKVVPPVNSTTKVVPPVSSTAKVPPVSSSKKVVRFGNHSTNGPSKLEAKVVLPVDSETKVVVPPEISPNNPSIQGNKLAVKEIDTPKWSFMQGKRGASEQAVQRVIKDPAPYETGPWGGEGGKPWDDGVFTGIRNIILTISHAICSIEIEYDRNGQSVWSVSHGGKTGESSQRVKMDFPNEVLTCISGYHGPISKEEGMHKVIKSLTFHTSRRKHGPFGEELGTYFCSGTTEGKVVGFHGRSSVYLDAIGVHMQHWLGSQKSKQSSILKMFS